MARMYPHELPTFVLENPLRSAERRIFDVLEKKLSSEFTVFYSRPWLGTAPDGREIDGEADFVVAHPDMGVLTIEVKGGGIKHDADTETWTSTDRNGVTHRIKNPVGQARQSKYQILKKLKKVPFWDPGYIRITHGVVLPDSAKPGGDLGADMPLELFAFAEDIHALDQWVQRRLHPAPDGEQYDPLGKKGISALKHLLARSFQLEQPLSSVLEVEEQRIIVLTEQQYHILEFLDRVPRSVIEGGAGSGKTMLAMEYARRLSAEDVRTLFTCLSRPLAEHLGTAFEEVQHVTVRSFPDLCTSMARETGVEVPENPDGHEFAEVLLGAVGRNPLLAFEAIIVDEAQDFDSEWIEALELCLRDEDSIFHIFLDNNQRIYDPNAKLPVDLPAPPYPLTRNLRNTRQIHRLTRCFYAGEAYAGAGPTGQEVQFIPAERNRLAERLVQHLGVLTKTERVRPGQIAVLASRPGQITNALRSSLEKHYDVNDAIRQDQDSIVLDTVRNFKGLESRVVVLLASQELLDDPELAYVGLSRGRLFLTVMGDGETLSGLRSMMGSGVRESRNE